MRSNLLFSTGAVVAARTSDDQTSWRWFVSATRRTGGRRRRDQVERAADVARDGLGRPVPSARKTTSDSSPPSSVTATTRSPSGSQRARRVRAAGSPWRAARPRRARAWTPPRTTRGELDPAGWRSKVSRCSAARRSGAAARARARERRRRSARRFPVSRRRGRGRRPRGRRCAGRRSTGSGRRSPRGACGGEGRARRARTSRGCRAPRGRRGTRCVRRSTSGSRGSRAQERAARSRRRPRGRSRACRRCRRGSASSARGRPSCGRSRRPCPPGSNAIACAGPTAAARWARPRRGRRGGADRARTAAPRCSEHDAGAVAASTPTVRVSAPSHVSRRPAPPPASIT